MGWHTAKRTCRKAVPIQDISFPSSGAALVFGNERRGKFSRSTVPFECPLCSHLAIFSA